LGTDIMYINAIPFLITI